MRRIGILLSVSILICCTFFSVQFTITPTQEEIVGEMEDPTKPYVFSTVNLSIVPVYSTDEYSLYTRRLKRINVGGSLQIHSPIRLDDLSGHSSGGGYESFGDIYPYRTMRVTRTTMAIPRIQTGKMSWIRSRRESLVRLYSRAL